MATNDGQQPATEYTSCFAGDAPIVLRIFRLDVTICEPRKTLVMAPENDLIVSVPWNVNSNAK